MSATQSAGLIKILHVKHTATRLPEAFHSTNRNPVPLSLPHQSAAAGYNTLHKKYPTAGRTHYSVKMYFSIKNFRLYKNI